MNDSEKKNTTWLTISVTSSPVLVDAVSDFLVGVTGAGVEILVDDASAMTRINAYLEEKNPDMARKQEVLAQVTEYVREVAGIFGVPVPDVECSVIAEQDWGAAWKEHFKPFAIIPGLVIKPTWEQYRAEKDEKIIEMDPGMAFGTGHHATTALSLRLLRSSVVERESAAVLDVGTGTGILGMAAALFGAAKVVAIDNDPDAVSAAAANVAGNGLAGKMAVFSTPLSAVDGPFDVVVANIVHDVLLELAGDLDRLTVPGGRLILSGLLTGDQSDDLRERLVGKGFRLLEHLQEKEWSALLFQKPKT